MGNLHSWAVRSFVAAIAAILFTGVIFSAAPAFADIAHPEGWAAYAPIPQPVFDMSAAVWNGKIYTVGGQITDATSTQHTQSFDATLGTWDNTLAPSPNAHIQGVAGAINGKIYLASGCTNRTCSLPTQTLHIYDIASDTWTTGPALARNHVFGTGAVLNNKLYIVGGTSQIGLDIFDPVTGWTSGPDLPTTEIHQNGFAAAVGGKLYVMGGGPGTSGTFVSQVDVYDSSTNTWGTAAPLPQGVKWATASVLNGKIHVTSGFGAPGYLKTHYVYDPVTNSWTTAADSLIFRTIPISAVVGNTYYEIGGCGSNCLTGGFDNNWGFTETPPQFGTIIVTKTANGGDAKFSLSADGGLGSFDLITSGGTASKTFANIPAGTYHVTETLPAGWTQNSNACATVVVSTGATATCTVTNTHTANGAKPLGWSVYAPIPQPVFDSSAAVVNDKIYTVGGQIGDATSTQHTEVYDPATDSWDNSKAPAPNAHQQGVAGALNGKIYLAAGCTDRTCNSPTTRLDIYDVATDSWTTGAVVPHAHAFTSGSMLGGKLYVAGGTTDRFGTPQLALDIYNPSTNSWTSGASLPSERHENGYAVALNGKLYVIGGGGAGVFVSTVDVYDPSTDTWASAAALPQGVKWAGASVLNGKIHVTSGFGAPGFLKTHYVYDPSTNSWTTAAATQMFRTIAANTTVGNTLYEINGCTGNCLTGGFENNWGFTENPPVITTSSPLPDANAGKHYSAQIATTGGTAPFTWSVAAGALPIGIFLSATGEINGDIPRQAQNTTFTIGVTDANGLSASKEFALHVDAPAVTYTRTPAGVNFSGPVHLRIQGTFGVDFCTGPYNSYNFELGHTPGHPGGDYGGSPVSHAVGDVIDETRTIDAAPGDYAEVDIVCNGPGGSTFFFIEGDDPFTGHIFTVTQPTTGTLTVHREVINNNGGTATAADFGVTQDFFQSGVPGVTIDVPTEIPADSYCLSDAGCATNQNPSTHEYEITYGGDCDINGQFQLDAGQSKTCTITYEDHPVQIQLLLDLTNDNNGAATPADFTLRVAGPLSFSNDGNGNNHTGADETNLTVGTYTLSATGPSGYTFGPWSCQLLSSHFNPGSNEITAALGDFYQCTITADDNAPTTGNLKFVKRTTGGGDGTFNFGSETVGPFGITTLDGEGSTTFNGLAAGTPVNVTENSQVGWSLQTISCSQAAIVAGETVTCTITNNALPSDLTIQKTNNVNGALTIGGTFNWNLVVTNSGDSTVNWSPLNGNTVLVQDDLPPGPTYGTPVVTMGSGVTGGPVTCAIDSGPQLVCTVASKMFIHAGETISVSIPVTPNAVGTLTNPQAGTVCKVNPRGTQAETDTLNNSCSDTVAVSNPAPTTGTITLVKQVTNLASGSLNLAPTVWTLSATGPTSIAGKTGSSTVTNVAVLPGTYTLSESNQPAFYSNFHNNWNCNKNGTNLFGVTSISLAAGDVATCTITNIEVPNHSPTGFATGISTNSDTPKNFSLSGVIRDSEENVGDTFTVSFSQSQHATIAGTFPNYTYLPDGTFAGSDIVTITATDSRGASSTTQLYVTVNAAGASLITNEGSTVGQVQYNYCAYCYYGYYSFYIMKTVSWTTSHPATSRLVYDYVPHTSLNLSDSNYGYQYSTPEDPALVTSHFVTFTPYPPGVTVYYRAISRGSPEAVSPEFSTSTQEVGTLVINHTTTGGNDAFAYTVTNTGAIVAVGTATTTNGVSTISVPLGAGTFSVTAQAPTGWTQVSTTCGSVTVAANATTTCSFVHSKPPTYTFGGFQQPINDTGHAVTSNTSVFKAGSTVPVKFSLLNSAGQPVQAGAAPTWLAPQKGSAMTAPLNESVFTDPGTSGTLFQFSSGTYQYNWKTTGLTPGFWYKIMAKLDTGEIVYTYIGLK